MMEEILEDVIKMTLVDFNTFTYLQKRIRRLDDDNKNNFKSQRSQYTKKGLLR